MSNDNVSHIEIEITMLPSVKSCNREKVIELVTFTCKKFSLLNAQISIAIVDDKQMQDVHLNFMDDSSTTDVMSFDLSDEMSKTKCFEIIVNADMATRQSKINSNSFEAELLLYILHGLLHNLGFDDLNDAEFKKMHKEEDEIMKALGWGVVYAR